MHFILYNLEMYGAKVTETGSGYENFWNGKVLQIVG